MSLINVPDTLSPRARRALQWLLNQSVSTATGLADTLCSAAESDPEMFGTDAALINEAAGMAGWANAFITMMGDPRDGETEPRDDGSSVPESGGDG